MARSQLTAVTKHVTGSPTSAKKPMTGATLTLKNIIILELYHVLNLIFVWLCSSKGRKIKTRLYGAIWHGAFMACFAYNACLEGGSQCAGGLIGIGLRQQYSDLLFPCGSQIQSILLYLSQSQCMCFKPHEITGQYSPENVGAVCCRRQTTPLGSFPPGNLKALRTSEP